MPLGIICPDPFPKYGATQSRGTLPFFVRGTEVPLLSDVEVAEYLGLRDHTLPDELLCRLDRVRRVGEGTWPCSAGSLAWYGASVARLSAR
jgi:hypothetical protein